MFIIYVIYRVGYLLELNHIYKRLIAATFNKNCANCECVNRHMQQFSLDECRMKDCHLVAMAETIVQTYSLDVTS